MLAFVAQVAWSAGGAPTTCADLCPDTPDPCVVTETVNVVPGSIIDCGDRAIQVTGGDLLVHDGRFALKARSILVQSKTIDGDCPAETGRQGFTLQATDWITVGQGGKLRASCDFGGGRIVLDAGGAIAIGGLGIQAKGTAQAADGGLVRLEADGDVTTTAAVDVSTTASLGDPASGGGVQISGANVTIGADVTTSGFQAATGQGIDVEATGNVTLNGALNAGTASGNGGLVTVTAGGPLQTTKPIKVRGMGTGTGGGTIQLRSDSLTLGNDLVAEGGLDGGTIEIETRGSVTVQSPAVLNASIGSSGPGTGGEITMRSEGGDVTIGASCVLRAEGGPNGEGGMIEIEGVAVTAAGSSNIEADGGTDQGGTIEVSARGPLSLTGTLHASNGDVDLTYRCTQTPCENPPVLAAGLTADPDPDMDDPCGDNVVRSGESCDGTDLAGATCVSQGFPGGGTLACAADCTFDTSGCSS